MEFHVKDGIYFRRDGYNVEIVKRELSGEREVILAMDCDTWASAIASMSSRGENWDTFNAARNLFIYGSVTL